MAHITDRYVQEHIYDKLWYTLKENGFGDEINKINDEQPENKEALLTTLTSMEVLVATYGMHHADLHVMINKSHTEDAKFLLNEAFTNLHKSVGFFFELVNKVHNDIKPRLGILKNKLVNDVNEQDKKYILAKDEEKKLKEIYSDLQKLADTAHILKNDDEHSLGFYIGNVDVFKESNKHWFDTEKVNDMRLPNRFSNHTLVMLIDEVVSSRSKRAPCGDVLNFCLEKLDKMNSFVVEKTLAYKSHVAETVEEFFESELRLQLNEQLGMFKKAVGIDELKNEEETPCRKRHCPPDGDCDENRGEKKQRKGGNGDAPHLPSFLDNLKHDDGHVYHALAEIDYVVRMMLHPPHEAECLEFKEGNSEYGDFSKCNDKTIVVNAPNFPTFFENIPSKPRNVASNTISDMYVECFNSILLNIHKQQTNNNNLAPHIVRWINGVIMIFRDLVEHFGGTPADLPPDQGDGNNDNGGAAGGAPAMKRERSLCSYHTYPYYMMDPKLHMKLMRLNLKRVLIRHRLKRLAKSFF